jgi:uncharacterized protein (TIGR02466 family)
MFPVPLLRYRLTGADELNRRLLQEIAVRRERGDGSVAPNRCGGWHSPKDLFNRKEPAHAELARELRAMIQAANSRMLTDARAESFVTRMEGWINVNPTNAMNAPHDHTVSFWSGCYYVHVPSAEPGEDALSGAIEFLDSRGALAGTAEFDTPFTRSRFTVRPAAGAVLIWPGFVKHWVYPNSSTEDRVTIAFNAWFRGRSGA